MIVCRDMEIRYSNTSKNSSRNVEICANDQWLVAISGRITAAVDSQMSNDFNFTVNVLRVLKTSDSVNLMWSLKSTVYSAVNRNRISKYDISCTTMFQEMMYILNVANVDRNTASIQISGLLPDSIYNCCVTAHILINGNLPIELIDSACATVKTLVSPSELKEYQFIAIALGTGLCVCCLLLLCTSISFITALWKWKAESKSLDHEV